MQNAVLRYDGVTGDFVDTFVPASSSGMTEPDLGIILDPRGRNFLVDGYSSHNVTRYRLADGSPHPARGQTGADFVPPGNGGLVGTEGLAFSPVDGNLYVANQMGGPNGDILEYSGGNRGTFIREFVATGSGGLVKANDLHFGPDGNLYVSTYYPSGYPSGGLLRYDGRTGDPLPSPGRSGANFIDPPAGGFVQGFAFGPDGRLYVAASRTGEIVRYDSTTGDLIDVFVPPGGLYEPDGMAFDGIAFGPDGNLYVTSHAPFGRSNVLSFDGATGDPLGSFVNSGSGGLNLPSGLLFYDDGNPAPPRSGLHRGNASSTLEALRGVFPPQETPNSSVAGLGDGKPMTSKSVLAPVPESPARRSADDGYAAGHMTLEALGVGSGEGGELELLIDDEPTGLSPGRVAQIIR
jgi:hypothetical protein